jgi:hypothetical protein
LAAVVTQVETRSTVSEISARHPFRAEGRQRGYAVPPDRLQEKEAES